MAGKYTASDIEVLEGLEPVRKRPGMYIGGTDGGAGLHHLVREILDNSIDEAMNGHASKILVAISSDCSTVTIEDNGRGIPVDLHPKHKKPALEIIMTTLHSGGKFSDRNYASAGGLHGVGASVVNALSEHLEVTVWRDGAEWAQSYSRGKPLGKLSKKGKTSKHGTKIRFKADPEIFSATEFSPTRMHQMVQEKAFLNRGLTIVFTNEGDGAQTTFCYPEGVTAYVHHLLSETKAQLIGGECFAIERANGMKIEAAFAWTESTSEKTRSYVNGIYTSGGGTHEDGFRSGLVKAVRNYLETHELIPKGTKVVADDIREGLVAVVAVWVPGALSQLQFQGQTKDRLNNPEVADAVESAVRGFEVTLNSKPTVAAAVCERVLLAAKARSAARAASQSVSRKVGLAHRLNLPGKLADCSSSRPGECEVFIVEGDSAGGSAKQGRDRKTQAVLPLRGKILNSFAAGSSKVQENKELSDLVAALGCGSGDAMRLERLRYDRVIILTDADADGMHIASLLMAFFFKFMRPLVSDGHLYIGLPPLYRLKVGGGKKGAEVRWAYSDGEKERLLKGTKERASVTVTRFKGLGEMNPETLWETTLDPKTRNLLRVKIEDEGKTHELFEALLGKDADSRFQLIQEHASRLEADI